MWRKGIKAKQRKRIIYDIRYTDHPADVNRNIAKFINVVMMDGKKSVAERIVFAAFEIISEKTKDDPVKVFEKAVANVRPRLEVLSPDPCEEERLDWIARGPAPLGAGWTFSEPREEGLGRLHRLIEARVERAVRGVAVGRNNRAIERRLHVDLHVIESIEQNL